MTTTDFQKPIETVPTTATKPSTLNAEQRRAIFQRRLRRTGVYALASLLALWILLPIWLIATMAFSTAHDVRAYPLHFAPIPFSTETMAFFVNAEGILPSTLNSLWVALLTMGLSTVIAVPSGYAISRFVFRGRDAIRLGILAIRAFPIVILAVPLAVIFINLGMYDSILSVALIHTALVLPSSVLVISSVFATVPYELEEAAKVFGCSPLQAFFKVVAPLVLPGIAASAIFAFVTSWNEVFAAMLLTLQNRTLPAQILFSLDKSGDPFKFAGAFFMLVPSMIFMFFIRRYLFNMWGQITK
jgi:multiple sugar transport system permease protein